MTLHDDPLLYHMVTVAVDSPTTRLGEKLEGPLLTAGSIALFVDIDEDGRCLVELEDDSDGEWYATLDRDHLAPALIGLPVHQAVAEKRLQRLRESNEGRAEDTSVETDETPASLLDMARPST